MNTWITSDLHFYHKSILRYCPTTRPYTDVASMNESMISEWNNTVLPDDLVYILGDCAFCNGNIAADTISQLNGRKILIIGNHDSSLLDTSAFINCFESTHQLLEITHGANTVVMCHYPMTRWNKSHFGSVHFFGHTHGEYISGCRSLDVGVDATGKIVSSLDDMIDQALLQPFYSNHK